MQRDFFRKVDTGFETMQIVQVDQKFLYHKPMLAGDKVWGRMEIISVDERFGADIVVDQEPGPRRERRARISRRTRR